MPGDFQRWANLAAAGGRRLEDVAEALSAAAVRLMSPMRLAVVGQIKQGKSTLVNALLGEDVAATGLLEVTFNVNELAYGDQPAVTVHYRDGTPPAGVPVDRLGELVTRDPLRLDELARIRMVEHHRPNELLRSFRLVDTPGLFSVHDADSQNTLEHLGLKGGAQNAAGRTARRIHRESGEEIGQADAVLYLYQGAVHQKDYATIDEFLGPEATGLTPLRAFGVMSRCDDAWPGGAASFDYDSLASYDPMAEAARRAEADLRHLLLGRVFYTIVPVSGLVGLAAQTLTAEHFAWLAEFGGLEPKVMAKLVRSARHMVNLEIDELPLSRTQRGELHSRLGRWGLFRACQYLNAGLGEDEVRRRLLTDSGIPRLRELVVRHFGTRARLIKLEHAFADVEQRIRRARADGRHSRLDDIAGRLERLKANRHEFAELAVLAAHYNGGLTLTDAEIADLLQTIAGGCADRLGAAPDASLDELERLAAAKIHQWSARERDPVLDPVTARAARTVRLSYLRVLDRVGRARRLLDFEDVLDLDTEGLP